MKETDPDLLREDNCTTLDAERIRQTYYSVAQDNYDKQTYRKLRKINKIIYPSTPQLLNDLKAKHMLENPHTKDMSLDRVLFLSKYLSLHNKVRVNPELAQKKAQEMVKEYTLIKKSSRKPPTKPPLSAGTEMFRRKKTQEVFAQFPTLRKGIQEESENQVTPKQMELAAFNRWESLLKKDKSLDEMRKMPSFQIVDDISRKIGIRPLKKCNSQNRIDDAVIEPDSYEVIKLLANKAIMRHRPKEWYDKVLTPKVAIKGSSKHNFKTI